MMRQFDGSYLHHNNINLETGLWAAPDWQWLIKTFPGIYNSQRYDSRHHNKDTEQLSSGLLKIIKRSVKLICAN